MKKVVIIRKRKIASALLDYWVITKVSRQEFVYKLDPERSQYEYDSDPATMTSINLIDLVKLGVRISNGQTIEIELDDNVATIFAATVDGRITEEIAIDDFRSEDGNYNICLTTKGGFKTPSYPCFVKK